MAIQKLKKDGTPSKQGEGGGQFSPYNEQTLKEVITEYFVKCNNTKVRPSKAGLRLALGITIATYSNYKKKYFDTLKVAEDMIEVAWIERLDGNSPTGAIFYLKNAFKEDYKDRHEVAGDATYPLS